MDILHHSWHYKKTLSTSIFFIIVIAHMEEGGVSAYKKLRLLR